jgi:cytoskeletal protein RodZ
MFNSSTPPQEEEEKQKVLTPISNSSVWFKPVILVTMALVAIGLVGGITFMMKNKLGPNVADYTPAPLPTSPDAAKDISPNENSEPPAQQGAETPKNDGLVAELTFKEDCWLQVKVDGKTVLDGYTVQGDTKTLQGKDKIEFVTVGNAGALEIKVNGTELAPLGPSKQVVRNIVITPDSIKSKNSVS